MEKLNIPDTINVGFQKREGTYTGKLAYVVYTDRKGVLRKEQSWNSWRDKKIAQEDFTNEPTSGFVLNKGVGGQRESWGWNARNEYIRVYDPRGFEFEISVANLLFILTNSNSIKGKGLEGEFVYAWDGADLILLPVDCFEYRASREFTDLQGKKVTKQNMKEGWSYQHKNTETLIYIGRFKVRNFDRLWGHEKTLALLQEPSNPRHVFWNPKSKDWHFETGFTKLAGVVSEESHPDFADLHSDFMQTRYVSKAGQVKLKPVTIEDVTNPKARQRWFYIKVDHGYQLVTLMDPTYYSGYGYGYRQFPTGQSKDHCWPVHPTVVKDVTIESLHRNHGPYSYDPYHSVTPSFLKDKELVTAVIQLGPRKTVEVENYV